MEGKWENQRENMKMGQMGKLSRIELSTANCG